MSFPTAEPPLIEAVDLSKDYPRGRATVHALSGVSFQIARGEFVAITGPSGAGKTTLLNLLGCMDAPSAGHLRILGRDAALFGENERTRFRREQIGFVFQHFGLIPTLTVEENVQLPLTFSRRSEPKRARELIERVGLSHRRGHQPFELSGGEMQRVAIARALINRPALLLADEPTGNLDSATGENVINLLQDLHHSGLTIIVVTHNALLAERSGRQIQLRDGSVGSEKSNPRPGIAS